jgi:hypothetical protein
MRYLFKPQQAWLVTRGMGGGDDSSGPGGENVAPGVTVFFHLPADYNGRTPVKLIFSDASGKFIRSFTLHLKAMGKPKPLSDNLNVARKQLYRAKLDHADRLIFALVRHGEEVCALMLEVVRNHGLYRKEICLNYRSRPLRDRGFCFSDFAHFPGLICGFPALSTADSQPSVSRSRHCEDQ